MFDSNHLVRFLTALFISVGMIVADLHFDAFAELRGKMSVALTPFRAVADLQEKHTIPQRIISLPAQIWWKKGTVYGKN